MEREKITAKKIAEDIEHKKGEKDYISFDYENKDGKTISLRFYLDNDIEAITGEEIEYFFDFTKKLIKKDRIALL